MYNTFNFSTWDTESYAADAKRILMNNLLHVTRVNQSMRIRRKLLYADKFVTTHTLPLFFFFCIFILLMPLNDVDDERT